MAQFVAFQKGVEVDGAAVVSFVEGMGFFKKIALETLAKHGINDPTPGVWYSQQAWLDAFREIAEKAKLTSQTLFDIGQAIPRSANFPPQIKDVYQALASIDVAYKMNHRGGQIGNYGCQKIDDQTIKMVCKNPYPCDFDRGIIEAMASRFKPANALLLTVTHDDSAPCRKKGADSCTYYVKMLLKK